MNRSQRSRLPSMWSQRSFILEPSDGIDNHLRRPAFRGDESRIAEACVPFRSGELVRDDEEARYAHPTNAGHLEQSRRFHVDTDHATPQEGPDFGTTLSVRRVRGPSPSDTDVDAMARYRSSE